ncbi:MAG TPA: RNA polymerase sigma factor [Solirubrobacteraceae bacterium]|jgi:RNA polymerase sigma factor (sigma-70 family)|nr:RNA polymerase sigma factor [Solirubrobacteraceae bacterium]
MEASSVPDAAPLGGSAFASTRFLRLASDARLVALVRQGVPSAFDAVYDRHHRPLLSFCRQLLGDHAEAEDVVQHAFLAAYNDLISSEKAILLRPWLFTIARNRCLSVLRARRERPWAEVEHAVADGPAAEVQRRQELRDLLRDLRDLPADQSRALVLAEFDALSHQEIAEQIGVPREKVKALVFQARESLQASRAARETACAEIRELLRTAHGGTLRRANLRRHLGGCTACREFRSQLGERRRGRLSVALLPAFALEESPLWGGATPAYSALKGVLVKAVAAALLAGGAGTIVTAAVDQAPPRPAHRAVVAPRIASVAARPARSVVPTGASVRLASVGGPRAARHSAASAPLVSASGRAPSRARSGAVRAARRTTTSSPTSVSAAPATNGAGAAKPPVSPVSPPLLSTATILRAAPGLVAHPIVADVSGGVKAALGLMRHVVALAGGS